MNNIGDLKDKAILFGWIAGLLIIIASLWILTQPLQANNLLRTVNNVFISAGDSRRLLRYEGVSRERPGLLGYWYSMYNSVNKMFVFPVFQDGILVPLGAIVSANGTVEEIIPLSAHAAQTFDSMPRSILQIYVTRIEAEALVNMRGRNR
jgi:hypothetical protein